MKEYGGKQVDVWMWSTSMVPCMNVMIWKVRHNGMGRWLWDVGNVRNELIRGETGWSTFEEREAKAMVKWMLRVVFEENMVSEIGRACLSEIGCKSRWWSRMQAHM